MKVDPKLYTKYVTVDAKGQKVLYVQLSKALYGLLRATILFYRKLRKELEEYGFEINPYDPCVANKMTESGKQLTVLWHVDVLKISCENDFETLELPEQAVRRKDENQERNSSRVPRNGFGLLRTRSVQGVDDSIH